jgi:hypothetical protein
MSDFFAVAGVTAVLKWLLANDPAVTTTLSTALGAQPVISALPTDRIAVGNDETPQLNIFLYHVSLNAAWRDAALPWRDDQGRRLSNPPLALNLHYLISAYGKHEFDGEILLAWAMQALHEMPVLTRDMVQNSLSAMAGALGATSEVQAIALTTLADQIELIKICPEVLSSEDIYKLWSAFQAKYRPTAAYQASVVLVQKTLPTRLAAPVQRRNIKAIPAERPVIEEVSPDAVAVGETLLLRGRHFIGDLPSNTKVSFDGGDPIAPDLVQDTALRVKIPNTPFAGVRSVQVVRTVDFDEPTDPHLGLNSEPARFTLVPTITAPLSGTIQVGHTLDVTVSPTVGRTQSAALVVGSTVIAIDARPPGSPARSATVSFPVPKDFPGPLPTGPLPLRVRVDGAQSRVSIDSGTGLPSPRLEVTA